MSNRAHKTVARVKPKPINKSEHKHYWPYIPMLVMVVAIFAISFIQPLSSHGVLAYASEMSSSGLLASTNSKRSQNGKAALALNTSLSRAAQAKANDMVKRDYWSHNTPDGNEPWVFIQQAGYTYKKAGENLAYGFSTSGATVTGWMNSASHKANMLDASYSEVGFGYANSADFNDSGPETVVVAMYGQPQVNAASASQPSTPTAPITQPASQPSPVRTAPAKLKPTVKPKPAGSAPVPPLAFTTDQPGLEPVTTPIAHIQTIAGGNMQWAVFMVGLLSGVALAILLAKHAVHLRHLLKDSERFVIHHPALDMMLVSLLLVGTLLLQTTGYIK